MPSRAHPDRLSEGEGSGVSIEIFKGKGRILPGYFFRLVGANGEPISVSESFTTKWSAKRSARRVAESLRVELVDYDGRAV